MSTRNYLNKCWRILHQGGKVIGLNYHICRVHVTKAMMQKVDECFGQDSESIPIIQKFVDTFLHSHRMSSIVFRVRIIFSLCSLKFFSSSIDENVTLLEGRTPESFFHGELNTF